MHLIYIHQHFVTNDGASGTRSYDVSRYLIEQGHRVTIICGDYDLSGLPRMPAWRLFETREIDGIKVVRCNSYYSNKQGVAARMGSFFKFGLLSFLAVVREGGGDLIFATSTPLTVGPPARLASAVTGIPYVFEVRDLWPDDLLDCDRLKPGIQEKVWRWMELFSYARARKILLVSRGFEDKLIERGFDPQRLATIPLGGDGTHFGNTPPDADYFRQQGLAGRFIAIYTGAHGDANGLSQVIDAAEHLRDRPDIALVLIGDGKMKPALREAVADRQLTNVYLHEPVPKTRIPGILAASHVGLMILRQISAPWRVTPNKLFDYLFTGIPTIVNFAGTTAELVETEGVGVAALPGDAADLAAKIRYFADHPDERRRIGEHAKRVAREKYDRRAIARQLAEVFEACKS